jgi:LAO/AO transport system kinase
VLVTTATSGDGIPELLAALDRHRQAGRAAGTPQARLSRAEAQVRAVLGERVWDRLWAPGLRDATRSVLESVAAHDLDPYAAADRLLEQAATRG